MEQSNYKLLLGSPGVVYGHKELLTKCKLKRLTMVGYEVYLLKCVETWMNVVSN